MGAGTVRPLSPGRCDVGVVGDEVTGKRACGDVEHAGAGEPVEGGAFVDGDVGHDLDGAVERRADVAIRGGYGEVTARGVEWYELAEQPGGRDGIVADARDGARENRELAECLVQALPRAPVRDEGTGPGGSGRVGCGEVGAVEGGGVCVDRNAEAGREPQGWQDVGVVGDEVPDAAGSLREVAARTGLSEAGLLHHFASKSELLTAVLEHRDELARPTLRADAGDGLKVLRDLVDVARRNADQPGVIELFAIVSTEATVADHPAHEYFRDRYARVRSMLDVAFDDLRRRGLLAAGTDAAHATTSTIALWDGLQVQWLYERQTVDVAAALERHLTSLLRTGVVY